MDANGEPCPMCLTAIYMSGIEKGYFIASVQDAMKAGMNKSEVIYRDLAKERDDRLLNLKRIPLEAGQENPLEI